MIVGTFDNVNNPNDISISYVDSAVCQGKPLVFTDVDKCEKWIWNDLDNLKAYGKSVYPEAVSVKEIHCVYKNKDI